MLVPRKPARVDEKVDDNKTVSDNIKDQQQRQQLSVPSLSLPKGGGAIRGLGEKYTVNPVTGTGSLSIPIYASPGRSGFGPQLSLNYDSGGGNGPFGFGWNLAIPAITRKTDKGLPKYEDANESDTFILSGTEDLVPVFKKDADGEWIHDDKGNFIIDEEERGDYVIRRYRPRIEGLFARIERWTRLDGDVHWRSISKDNVLTVYGSDKNSRICDPSDPSGTTRVFSWLICETYDDKGNAILFDYKPENSQNIDISAVHEQNRSDNNRSSNRYLKRIKYGNKTPLKSGDNLASVDASDWMFELVFDYGEHYSEDDDGNPTFVSVKGKERNWESRQDPFSSFRAGFEIRTYRLCQRVLMFHHFPKELGVADYLVRSTELNYTQNPFASFITSITQSGYVRKSDGKCLKKSLPPIEFDYSEAKIEDKVKEVDSGSLENLPSGLDGLRYQWIDLDGEGLSGILAEQQQNGAWYYKRNLSSLPVVGVDGKPTVIARFAPIERVANIPSLANRSEGSSGQQHQLLDLTGDGKIDFVKFDTLLSGYFERTFDETWEPFIPFASLPNINWNDPNLRFIDLTGDGYADILITEDDVFIWYPSLAKTGFKEAENVRKVIDDEEKGPKLIFADGSESVFLADMSGDGLTDLVRIRNGEVCYWPNLGYGRFGAKVAMDNAPWFDTPDLFDQRRIRLADIDGSGVTDIIYLGHDGVVRLYFNHSGNSLSFAPALSQFPAVDNLSSVMVVDLLGNGTACLVWSSPLPSNELNNNNNAMRYISLMGEQKPYLLVSIKNNLGAETKLQYAPSTKFYLADKYAGKPWVTRLPFPVHVVERVETYDWISRNRFVSRYTYHHGYFDGTEREFRGFGLVEQWDTEEFAVLTAGDTLSLPPASNIEESSHVPPVLTKTWFHTGAYFERERISAHFEHEYYQEPESQLLPDTILPPGLTAEEEREACRALKGSILHQEIYALDNNVQSEEQQEMQPYLVSERNYAIRLVQPKASKNHDHYAVFFSHASEMLDYRYEHKAFDLTTTTSPSDPRVSHSIILDVDDFGNVVKQASIGYGRRHSDSNLPLDADRDKQTKRLVIYTENRFTTADPKNPRRPAIDSTDSYRTPLPCESLTYELTGYIPTGAGGQRFQLADFVEKKPDDANILVHIFDDEINYENQPTSPKQRRLIEQVRTLYRKNDLTSLLPLGVLESLALPGETYKLAFTPTLLTKIYGDRVNNTMLSDKGGSGCGYVHFPDGRDVNWWVPSGRIFFSPSDEDNPAKELAFAQQHFFLPHRFRDPFGNNSIATFDKYALLIQENRDALDNVVTVVTKDSLGNNVVALDYRVLQPRMQVDPNGNRSAVAFDALGLVVGTAVMGKIGESIGDSLDGFEPDLTEAQIDGFYNVSDPHVLAQNLLKEATTRLIYDVRQFHRARQAHPEEPTLWLPVWTATLARETHVSDHPLPPPALKIQISFSYSDGFGREIQKKIQAEPGPLVEGELVVSPRWVGSGWTIFNNKDKPVRQYEPFFSRLPPQKRHHFEYASTVGISPVLFYDPLERVVATLYPNHSYEKVVFNPWEQINWDVNDTIRVPDNAGDPPFDPKNDPDVGHYFGRLLDDEYLPTWYDLRTDAAKALKAWPNMDARGHPIPDNVKRRDAEKSAADKAAAHAMTPSVSYFDTLGRPFLTTLHNKVVCKDHDLDGTEDKFHIRIELDIEGNQRSVRDEVEQNSDKIVRIIMLYDYDMVGNRIHQSSMEAGERWMLKDVTGKSIRTWDSRGHVFRTEYDPLRRPLRIFVTGADPKKPNQELLTERSIYGEQHPKSEIHNLRDKLYCHLDQSGLVTHESHDFKGNLLSTARRIAKEYRQAMDWRELDADHVALPTDATKKLNLPALVERAEAWLEKDTFSSSTIYDALNRPVQVIAPHSDQPGIKYNIIQPVYNEANLLEQVDVWLDRSTEPTGLLDAAVTQPSDAGVRNIDYDAKGQRLRIDYRNGTSTLYEYDPLTFRLVHLLTLRNAVTFPQDCPQPPTAGWPGCQVQNLHYVYDPIGNITFIRDDAQQRIFFREMRVEPNAEYTYDAIYRLVKATGREHLGQVNGAPIPHSYNDVSHLGLQHPNDGRAMGNYRELYVYDAVGNILKMQHYSADPARPAWTRSYAYEETSLIEDGTNDTLHKTNNALSSTTVAGNHSSLEPYAYDNHGNLKTMPHLPLVIWDHKDQLHATSKQKVSSDNIIPETTYYTYDSAGQRVRKVTERQARKGTKPARKEERIYLSGFEVYYEYRGDGNTIKLQRETLHIMNNTQRIAVVETRVKGDEDISPKQLIRYQFGNHLGSANLELSDVGKIISYEEYYPYGGTSLGTIRSKVETAKRYRYTGKERDEESGFYYYGARYYAAWLGRWASPDPSLLISGENTSPVTSFRDRGGSKQQDSDSKRQDDMNTNMLNESNVYFSKQQDSDSKRQDDMNTNMLNESNVYLFAYDNPVIYYDQDGKAPLIGHIYVIEGTLEGKRVHYTGQTAQKLRERFNEHQWKALLRQKDTTVSAHEVYADLSIESTTRKTLASATKRALSSAEQGVMEKEAENVASTELNAIRGAGKGNMEKWAVEHNVSVGKRFTFKGGVGMAAFAGFALLEAYKMYRESKMSKYVMEDYLLEDEKGLFTMDAEVYVGLIGMIFLSDHYYKVYVTGDLKGQKVEISKSELEENLQEARALWGYVDWAGDFIPGLLRRELPVVVRDGA